MLTTSSKSIIFFSSFNDFIDKIKEENNENLLKDALSIHPMISYNIRYCNFISIWMEYYGKSLTFDWKFSHFDKKNIDSIYLWVPCSKFII